VDSKTRIVGRRLAVAAVVLGQLFFVARGYWSTHKEFAFQMFPESSTWQASIVRVIGDGERISVTEPWAGYTWNDLVSGRGLQSPWIRHHADAGVDNQLAFLRSALQWVADHTPRDRQTRYLEATVTYWHNLDPPQTLVLRTDKREESR
jgi:hypothetical protein